MSKKIKIWVHIILPIIVGSTIYLLFRPKSILIFDCLKQIHVDSIIDAWRLSVKGYKLFDWIVFCLPGGLWLYSYTYAVGMSWKNEINRKNLFWYLLPLIISISSEFGQRYKIVKGTFDWLDIGFYTLSTIIAILFLSPKIMFKKETG